MRRRESLGTHAAVFTLTNGLSAAIPFLMLPVLTRVLSPEDYGKVAMYSVLVTVLGALTGLNVHGAVGIRYLDRDTINFPQYVASCLVILGASTLIILAATPIFMHWLQPLTQLPSIWLVGAVVASCAQFVVFVQLSIWQFSQQPWKYGALRIFQTCVDAVMSLVLVIVLGYAWQGRVSGIATATLLSGLISLILMWRSNWIGLPPKREYIVNALRFGVPLVPHVLGGMLIALVDRFIISDYLDAAHTGIYMVAVQVGMILGIATDSFNKAYAPWLLTTLARLQPNRDVMIVRYTYLYFALVLIVALLMGKFSPTLLGVMVGGQFRAAAPIVTYVALGFAFGGMYYMVANYIFFSGKTYNLAALTLVCGAFNVMLCYLLLSRNGLIGAAQSFMLAQAMLFIGAWWLANRSRPMPWFRAIWRTR